MTRWPLIVVLGLLVILALGALFTAWRVHWSQQRFPPLGQLFTHSQATLHYTDRGNGPVLVLLHGATTNLRDFSALGSALAANYRVIAVDRPGSGYSTYHQAAWLDPQQQARLVVALLKHLGVSQSVWAGHSLAGSVVMAGLLHSPLQVRAGILIAGAVYPWDGGVDFIDHLPGIPVLGPMSTTSLIIPAAHLALPAGIVKAFAPEPPTADYRPTSGIDLYLRPTQFAATGRDIRRLSQFLVRQSQEYARVSQPLLMIHGDADDIVPAWNHADRLIKLRPDATYHRIAGGGHQPHHVHAAAVSGWIGQFLRAQSRNQEPAP